MLKIKQNWRWLILLALIPTAFYLLKPADLAGIYAAIKKISFAQLLFLIIMQFVSQSLVYYQWQRICRQMGHPIRNVQAVCLNLNGTIAEAFTPGVKIGGEVFRVWYLRSKTDCQSGKALKIVLWQKAFSITAFLFCCSISLIILSRHLPELVKSPVNWTINAVLVLAMLVFVILLLPNKIYNRLKLTGRIKKLLAVIRANDMNRRSVISNGIVSLVIWILYPLKFLYLTSLFSSSGNTFLFFAITFLSYLAAMLPITPGGLGTFEATMAGLLVMAGLPAHDSAAIAIIFRFITFGFVLFSSFSILGIMRFRQGCRR